MKLWVFWGDIPKSFEREDGHSIWEYPELKEYEPEKGKRPDHPDNIIERVKDMGKKIIRLNVENGFQNAYLTTYSELVLAQIRFLSLNAYVQPKEAGDQEFPYYDQIVFIIPDKDGIDYNVCAMTEFCTLEGWPDKSATKVVGIEQDIATLQKELA